MRLLVLFDNSIPERRVDVDIALERIRADYKDSTVVSWEYGDRDFSNLRWVEYLPGALGIAWDIVYKDMNAIPKDKYDDVVYLLSEENWKAIGFGGWSLGSPINGIQVQLVRIYANNPVWLYKTFAMEIAHSWNDLTIQELGDNLLTTFGVYDFDNQVIHGCDSRYGVNVPPNPPMTGYYTTYDYTYPISLVKDKLKVAYEKRLIRYTSPIQFQFTKNLYFGMYNNDVLELQKRLGIDYSSWPGGFGVRTLAAVKAYQASKNIPTTGFVGVLTRASLNSTTATPDGVELSEIMKD